MIEIPFNDFQKSIQAQEQALEAALKRVLHSGYYTGGAEVKAFESQFSAYCNTRFAVAVSTGTAALQVCMMALGIGKGDEVIVPAHTFIATALSVVHCGATPVFCDVERETGNLNPAAVADHITSKTKAIIGVHLYGRICNTEELRKICRQHQLYFIEDAAQAHGAETRDGVKAGNLSDAACFSFYPTKNLGALGEGGGITFNREEWLIPMQQWRDYGRSDRYIHELPGYNYRMQEMQAAVLSVKLQVLDNMNRQRIHLAHRYHQQIQHPLVTLPALPKHPGEQVYHLFVIRVKNRDQWIAHFTRAGIATLIHYPVPCHLQPVFKAMHHRPGSFPEAEQWSAECLSIPLHPYLSESDQDRIIEVIHSFPQTFSS